MNKPNTLALKKNYQNGRTSYGFFISSFNDVMQIIRNANISIAVHDLNAQFVTMAVRKYFLNFDWRHFLRNYFQFARMRLSVESVKL